MMSLLIAWFSWRTFVWAATSEQGAAEEQSCPEPFGLTQTSALIEHVWLNNCGAAALWLPEPLPHPLIAMPAVAMSALIDRE
jgi:hypothetical protein